MSPQLFHVCLCNVVKFDHFQVVRLVLRQIIVLAYSSPVSADQDLDVQLVFVYQYCSLIYLSVLSNILEPKVCPSTGFVQISAGQEEVLLLKKGQHKQTLV